MELPSDASKDQLNVPNGYYRRNTGMLHQVPAKPPEPPQTQITEAQLHDRAYLRNLAMAELVDIVRQNAGDIKGIAAVKELLDRSEGRVAQAVELTGKNGGAVEVKDITPLETARRVAFLLASAPVIDAEYTEVKS